MTTAGDLAGEGVERGLASWYGADFAGLPTASGETFEPDRISAAHRALPLGTVVDVTNEKNGRTVRVRINDRGPFIAGRIVDESGLKRFVNVYLNDEDVRFLDGLQTPVADADSITILPAVAGGRR